MGRRFFTEKDTEKCGKIAENWGKYGKTGEVWENFTIRPSLSNENC
jgi:hypothetical protein